jgi:hypothetical protein
MRQMRVGDLPKHASPQEPPAASVWMRVILTTGVSRSCWQTRMVNATPPMMGMAMVDRR